MLKFEIFTHGHDWYYKTIVVKVQTPSGRILVDEFEYKASYFRDFFDLLNKAIKFMSYEKDLSITYHVDNCEGSQQTHSCSG